MRVRHLELLAFSWGFIGVLIGFLLGWWLT